VTDVHTIGWATGRPSAKTCYSIPIQTVSFQGFGIYFTLGLIGVDTDGSTTSAIGDSRPHGDRAPNWIWGLFPNKAIFAFRMPNGV